jgi:hypothetical protein
MALSEQYTNDRLDRLAGDIRDEAASRREDNFRLRSTLRKGIVTAATLLIAVLAFVGAPGDADAAPLMSSPSTHHMAPASAALIEIRTDQRFDDLNRKIDSGSDRAAEELRQLWRHMKSDLKGVEDESRRRAAILYGLTVAIVIFLFFISSVSKLSLP